MKNTTEVRDKLVEMLGTISVAQGYNNDFDTTKIRGYFDPALANDESDALYPKTFVCIEGSKIDRQIGNDARYSLGFLIIHVVKRVTQSQSPQQMLELALKDFERFFELNDTLGGFVQEANLVELKPDGGVLDPEGVLIMRVTTERSRYGNP
jgi:hypothetical protein